MRKRKALKNQGLEFRKVIKLCGGGKLQESDFIPLERYEEVLKKLISYGFFQEHTAFHIYRLGEPCLHPKLNEILKITASYGRKVIISTNASKIPSLDEQGLEGVSRVLLSMPGFSQESYDKIHGFRFETIKENIIQIKSRFDEMTGGRIPFDLSYHIYQFNQNEMFDAMKFCNTYGIRFAPNYAVLMDKNKCFQYVTNKMPYEELKDISKELFLGVLDHQVAVSPRNYCDFQENFLSITEQGDVVTCNAYAKDWEERICCGNILNDAIERIIEKKYNHERCKACIAAGLTLAKGYDCKVFPDYLYSVMKENEYLNSAVAAYAQQKDTTLLEKEILFMHTVRSFEEFYDEELLCQLQPFMAEISVEKAKEIIEKYCRFPQKTWEQISQKLLNQ